MVKDIINEDRDLAVFKLGISLDVIDLLDSLTLMELVKVADSTIPICSFRVNSLNLLNILSGKHKERNETTGIQSAVIIASSPIRELQLCETN